jgi:hypothetical protein
MKAVTVFLTLVSRLQDDERPRRYVLPSQFVFGGLGQSAAMPAHYRRQIEALEVRDVPDDLTPEQVQDFAQACLNAARGFPLVSSPTGSFVRWSYLLDIARQKRIEVPTKAARR